MKISFLVFIAFSFGRLHSQIEPQPSKFKKITFVYETATNYEFGEMGIYADTLLLKNDFPHQRFVKVNSPSDNSKTIGYIAKSQLNESDMAYLFTMLSYTNSRSKFVYLVKKNAIYTTITVTADKKTKTIFRNFFEKRIYAKTHGMRMISYKSPNVHGTHGHKSHKIFPARITWYPKAPNAGYITYQDSNYYYRNEILVNPSLNKFITPLVVFENCESGIEKLSAADYTSRLVSVKYK